MFPPALAVERIGVGRRRAQNGQQERKKKQKGLPTHRTSSAGEAVYEDTRRILRARFSQSLTRATAYNSRTGAALEALVSSQPSFSRRIHCHEKIQECR